MLCAMQMNYQNKDALMGAMIVAGYDDQKGGQVMAIGKHWTGPLVPPASWAMFSAGD
jgi:hypothetical protein